MLSWLSGWRVNICAAFTTGTGFKDRWMDKLTFHCTLPWRAPPHSCSHYHQQCGLSPGWPLSPYGTSNFLRCVHFCGAAKANCLVHMLTFHISFAGVPLSHWSSPTTGSVIKWLRISRWQKQSIKSNTGSFWDRTLRDGQIAHPVNHPCLVLWKTLLPNCL